MSSSEISRVKRATRKYVSILRKSASLPFDCSSLTPICEQWLRDRSPAEIKPPESTQKFDPLSKPTLTSSYRPFLSRKSSKNCINKSSSKRPVSNQFENANVNIHEDKPSPSKNHLSNLTQNVSLLALEEKVFEATCYQPSTDPRVTSSAVRDNEQEVPWYRFYRPAAPKPHLMKNPGCITLSDGCASNHLNCNRSLSACCTSPTHCMDLSISKSYPNNEHGMCMEPLKFTYLEQEADQENICDSKFPLPPPPQSATATTLLQAEEFNAFPSPPPLAHALIEFQYESQRPTLQNKESLPTPLSPITNIMSNPGPWGARLPRWSVEYGSLAGTTAPSIQLPFIVDSESSSSPSSTPSPPPRIVERVPHLMAPANLTEKPIATLDSVLIKPTVLKRGAPDGAEQKSDESKTCESKATSVPCQFTSKRSSTSELFLPDTSPKKLRTHLLVPSEHSAFLPVVSLHTTRFQPISSPCL